jgi:hypothetical protein
LSTIICFEVEGETRCESEEERARRELEERLKQLEDKLSELLTKLTQEYEVEITLDSASGKGVGKWRKKQR